jgi:pimeloyl-ACP methyl ester carboxylesterase
VLNPGRYDVKLDGVTQAFEISGQGPVCFVHSGGPGVDSDYLRMPEVEQYMTLVYLDPIGTGKSGLLPGGDYSVREYARRVELLRALLGVSDGFLLGHSHGGFVALQYALDYPGLMRGLIVYDSAPTGNLYAEAVQQMDAFAERWPDRPEAIAAARIFKQKVNGELPISDRESHQEYLSVLRPAYFADFRRTSWELGPPPEIKVSVFDPDRKPESWDVRGRLGGIEEPCLLIVGSYDFICPPSWSRAMHAEMPNSGLAEFTESGHFAHIEEPQQFLKSMVGFLEELES